MTTAMLSDRLVIRNDLAELRRMTHWLHSSCEGAGISRDLVNTLDFCANELVTNIISYAYEDGGSHDITLELNGTASGARLVISDDGKPFDLLMAPAHVSPGSLAEARIGGLGIHLVRHMLDNCEYRRTNGLNVLSIEAQRKPQSGNV